MVDQVCSHCETPTQLRLSKPLCGVCYRHEKEQGYLPILLIKCEICGRILKTNRERSTKRHSACTEVVRRKLKDIEPSRREKILKAIRREAKVISDDELYDSLPAIRDRCIAQFKPATVNGVRIEYSQAPVIWGLPEFMAKLDHSGVVARQYLENRNRDMN